MSERSELLARLAAALARPGPGRDLAHRLGEGCREILGADGASITLFNSTAERLTLYASDRVAGRLEELQDVLTEGPCWQAFRTGQEVLVTVAGRGPEQWPEFDRAALAELGELTVHAVPMMPERRPIGVLSLYQRRPDGPLTEQGRTADARFLADAIGYSLAGSQLSGRPDDNLPWSGRAKIHQATGFVISQLRITPADALALLRAHAFAEQRSVAVIAERVLDGTLDFRRDLT